VARHSCEGSPRALKGLPPLQRILRR